MTPEQIQSCKDLYARIRPYRLGNPDRGGKWYVYEDYINLNDREWVLFWEALIWELKQHRFPHTLPKAVKYVVLSEMPPKFESIFKLIHWLEAHPECV